MVKILLKFGADSKKKNIIGLEPADFKIKPLELSNELKKKVIEVPETKKTKKEVPKKKKKKGLFSMLKSVKMFDWLKRKKKKDVKLEDSSNVYSPLVLEIQQIPKDEKVAEKEDQKSVSNEIVIRSLKDVSLVDIDKEMLNVLNSFQKMEEELPDTARMNFVKKLSEIEFEDFDHYQYEDFKILKHFKNNFTTFLCSINGRFGVLKKYKTNYEDFTWEDFKHEIETFQKIKTNEYILKINGVLTSSKCEIGLVKEFCRFGNLKEFLLNNPNIPFFERIRMGLEIASGMKHLHSFNYLHRGIDPSNILINGMLSCKIDGIGISRLFNSMNITTTSVGSVTYLAPELRKEHGKYNSEANVYSFAVLFYVIMTSNFQPFGIKNGRFGNEDVTERPTLNVINQKWIRRLLSACWDDNPSKRPSFVKIVEVFEREMKENEIFDKIKEFRMDFLKFGDESSMIRRIQLGKLELGKIEDQDNSEEIIEQKIDLDSAQYTDNFFQPIIRRNIFKDIPTRKVLASEPTNSSNNNKKSFFQELFSSEKKKNRGNENFFSRGMGGFKSGLKTRKVFKQHEKKVVSKSRENVDNFHALLWKELNLDFSDFIKLTSIFSTKEDFSFFNKIFNIKLESVEVEEEIVTKLSKEEDENDGFFGTGKIKGQYFRSGVKLFVGKINNSVIVVMKEVAIEVKKKKKEYLNFFKDSKFQKLYELKHENILDQYGMVLGKENIVMFISEYCSNGDLLHFLHENKNSISEKKALEILFGICKAMKYLEKQKIILKGFDMTNIFIDDELTPKISIFNLCNIDDKKNENFFNTKLNDDSSLYKGLIPPGMKNEKYLTKYYSNVFAYGMLMYKMLLVKEIYPICNIEFPFENPIKSNEIIEKSMIEKIKIKWMKKIVLMCWDLDSVVTFEEIYQIFEKNVN